MITLILFILLLTTLYLLIRQHIKRSQLLLIITSFLFVLTGIGIFSSYFLNRLESYPTLNHPPFKKNNAIILLGAGAVKIPEENTAKPTILAYSRIVETARLYNLCKNSNNTCKIIISGGDALSTGQSEAEVYQNTLNAIGIKNTDIILESHSMNTYKNAEFTSAILKEKHFDNVLLVTSGIHMKRALLYFSQFGINPIPSVSDTIPAKIFIIPIGYNFAITDFVIHEYMGIARFHLYNYLGWNNHSAAPGSV